MNDPLTMTFECVTGLVLWWEISRLTGNQQERDWWRIHGHHGATGLCCCCCWRHWWRHQWWRQRRPPSPPRKSPTGATVATVAPVDRVPSWPNSGVTCSSTWWWINTADWCTSVTSTCCTSWVPTWSAKWWWKLVRVWITPDVRPGIATRRISSAWRITLTRPSLSITPIQGSSHAAVSFRVRRIPIIPPSTILHSRESLKNPYQSQCGWRCNINCSDTSTMDAHPLPVTRRPKPTRKDPEKSTS